ncbi:isopenicillin N synthase family dioxygenase [Qipengyuania atrilutea]|uniref:2-oxoglutarate-dependent ethylene/succinate-forming enzyme n=1 Tax=Qipengyuania atrilutea TaxID=2744473 RepID=A0A850HE75_9SPHN|nr:isopenicillin N synthase family oxygenase [Actirhodobacter atriluteus]NVD45499.1 isopenicillin N synthase family oxygenase [Actirhodobacter atriluteus]
MSKIASVSLARPLPEVSGELGRSFAEYGFAIVRDHGIPAELISRAEQLTRAFFALPDETKRAYRIEGGGGARGYTPFGTEKAKDANVHDLKEFWHVGRDLPEGHPLSEYMAPNIWPSEMPEFRDTFEKLYAAFDEAGRRVLQAIALHLDLPQHFFDETVEDGNSVMRLLHYPPLAPEDADGAIRAAAHGDINTITLLLGAEEAGLELLTQSDEWLAVNPPEGALVVNIGDMLERLTNGHLRSTKHRVVNPEGAAAHRARYSMPFFLHFRPDYVIETLPSCIDPSAPEDHPEPISAHDFLMQRLREINLV